MAERKDDEQARQNGRPPGPKRRRPKPPARGDQPAAEASISAAEQVDIDLARAALEKRQHGETPTSRELEALRRVERRRDERLRDQHYRTIPKKLWRKWSGRQNKVLDEQADRYGIPFGSATISLPDVVRALHDFFARHAGKLAAEPDGDASIERQKKQIELNRARRKDEREQLAWEIEQGIWIGKSKVQSDLKAVGQAFVDATHRASSDLATELAGRSRSEVTRIVREYFHAMLLELANKGTLHDWQPPQGGAVDGDHENHGPEELREGGRGSDGGRAVGDGPPPP